MAFLRGFPYFPDLQTPPNANDSWVMAQGVLTRRLPETGEQPKYGMAKTIFIENETKGIQ
jgi:hypothetical protein